MKIFVAKRKTQRKMRTFFSGDKPPAAPKIMKKLGFAEELK